MELSETPVLVHYSGVVVIVPPDRTDRCARAIDTLSGVEVHYRHPESGRIVVVLESSTSEAHERMLRQIQAVPDVLAAAPVYHYLDESTMAEQPVSGSHVERKEAKR